MIQPTPYADLNAVLRLLVSGVQHALGNTFAGAYLQGSFAVGDFGEHSDVDFIIVVHGELSNSQVETLQALHGRVHDLESEWAKHLEGSYFPSSVLRDLNQRRATLWYLDHGSRLLVRSTHCNTIVVRQVLRDVGVTLAGLDPATLIDPIPVDTLRDEIRATMLDWGREILANPQPYANRFYQGYIVLNYARMLHDLVVGRPGSKRAPAPPAASIRAPADPLAFAHTLDSLRLTMAEPEPNL